MQSWGFPAKQTVEPNASEIAKYKFSITKNVSNTNIIFLIGFFIMELDNSLFLILSQQDLLAKEITFIKALY